MITTHRSVRRHSSRGAFRTSMNSRMMIRTLTRARRIAPTVTRVLGAGKAVTVC